MAMYKLGRIARYLMLQCIFVHIGTNYNVYQNNSKKCMIITSMIIYRNQTEQKVLNTY